MDQIYSVLNFNRAQSTKEWLYSDYMPELKGLVANKKIPWYSAIEVMFKFCGVVSKLAWAIIWQEETIISLTDEPDHWIYSSGDGLMWAALITPHLNWYASMFSGFTQTDD